MGLFCICFHAMPGAGVECRGWAAGPFFVSVAGGGQLIVTEVDCLVMASKEEQLKALLAPVVESLGCEFWGLEYIVGGPRKTLRVYIDKADGVALEDCEAVSRQVSSVLDVEDPVSGEYTLEVSSPGMDRPLYTLAQYSRFAGETVSLRLCAPFEGRRKFKGLLQGVEGDEVVLVVDDEELLLPIESIEKANIVPRF